MKRNRLFKVVVFIIAFYLGASSELLWSASDINFEPLEEPIQKIRRLYPIFLVQKEMCSFHQLPLLQDNVGIFNKILPYSFLQDQQSYFPNANSSIVYDCGFVMPSESNTYILYCPVCRLVETSYLLDSK